MEKPMKKVIVFALKGDVFEQIGIVNSSKLKFRKHFFNGNKEHKHWHKSEEEANCCRYLMQYYGEGNVIPNFRLGRCEIDFAITENGKVIKFIEYHPSWREELETYRIQRERLIQSQYGQIPLEIIEKLSDVPKKRN